MKKTSTLILLLVSLNVFAQFPAPINFQYQQGYVHLNDCDFCLGRPLCGPISCSAFSWEAPNTSIVATLDHYNIYNQNESNITRVLASVKDLNYFYPSGMLGKLWVTAVYTNPNGESLPSNILTGMGFATSIIQNSLPEKIVLRYDKNLQLLYINTSVKLTKVNMINTQGRIIKIYQHPVSNIALNNYPNGLYIVEIYNDDGRIFRQKIIK